MAATSDRGSRTETPTKYVLPKPPSPGQLIVEPETAPAGGAADIREIVLASQGEARSQVAQRFLDLLECQDRFFAELRLALQEMGDAVHGDSRVRLLRHCHTLGEILDWAETVQADLRQEAEQARDGKCPVDLGLLVQEIARELEERDPELRIQVVETSRKTTTWGDPRILRHGLRSAVRAVCQRGTGGVAVEVGHEAGHVRLHLLGLGEPKPLQDEGLVDAVREMLGHRHGARLLPGPSGPAGTGMIILLPGI